MTDHSKRRLSSKPRKEGPLTQMLFPESPRSDTSTTHATDNSDKSSIGAEPILPYDTSSSPSGWGPLPGSAAPVVPPPWETVPTEVSFDDSQSRGFLAMDSEHSLQTISESLQGTPNQFDKNLSLWWASTFGPEGWFRIFMLETLPPKAKWVMKTSMGAMSTVPTTVFLAWILCSGTVMMFFCTAAFVLTMAAAAGFGMLFYGPIMFLVAISALCLAAAYSACQLGWRLATSPFVSGKTLAKWEKDHSQQDQPQLHSTHQIHQYHHQRQQQPKAG